MPGLTTIPAPFPKDLPTHPLMVIDFDLIKAGDVDNDSTLELLVKEALSHARAGADMVAPSDMMDGRVGAIRKSLDQNGFENIAIIA